MVVVILGIFLGLSTPYLLGAKEKLILQTEQEKVINNLKLAQQKAMAAYGGYAYKISFLPPDTYALNTDPETNTETYHLHPDIDIVSTGGESEIIFSKVTGTPNINLNLTLESRRFRCEITVTQGGLIAGTNPSKK